jgi:hypothetical protein
LHWVPGNKKSAEFTTIAEIRRFMFSVRQVPTVA